MYKPAFRFIAALLCSVLMSNAASAHSNPTTMTVSWYGPGLQGNPMANGDRFDMNDPTVVAHKSLPFGTKLRLRNPENDKTVTVTVQDRGPYIAGRELDVSKEAARRLEFLQNGVIEVEVEVVE